MDYLIYYTLIYILEISGCNFLINKIKIIQTLHICHFLSLSGKEMFQNSSYIVSILDPANKPIKTTENIKHDKLSIKMY